MGIGSAKTKGTHTRPSRNGRTILACYGFPWSEFICDKEWSSLEIDIRIELFKMDVRRNLSVFDGQQSLEQAGYSGGSLQMANVGLY